MRNRENPRLDSLEELLEGIHRRLITWILQLRTVEDRHYLGSIRKPVGSEQSGGNAETLSSPEGPPAQYDLEALGRTQGTSQRPRANSAATP